MKLKIITHYAEEDVSCCFDYYSIEILDENGKSICFYGDSYHDKGKEKIEGFIAGVEYILGEEVQIIEENKADGVY